MPPLDESWQGGAEPIDTHPRCSFEAQPATRSPLSPRTKGGTPALHGYRQRAFHAPTGPGTAFSRALRQCGGRG
jgi:hypothetical protein